MNQCQRNATRREHSEGLTASRTGVSTRTTTKNGKRTPDGGERGPRATRQPTRCLTSAAVVGVADVAGTTFGAVTALAWVFRSGKCAITDVDVILVVTGGNETGATLSTNSPVWAGESICRGVFAVAGRDAVSVTSR